MSTGKKGHASAERHIQASEKVIPLLPKNCKVVLLFNRFETIYPLQKGKACYLKNVGFAKSTAMTLNIISWWGAGYVEPIFLITNMDNPYAACRYYRQRFQIETFFSDQKSRDLHIHKSHLQTRLDYLDY